MHRLERFSEVYWRRFLFVLAAITVSAFVVSTAAMFALFVLDRFDVFNPLIQKLLIPFASIAVSLVVIVLVAQRKRTSRKNETKTGE